MYMFLTSVFCLYFIFLNFQVYLSFRNSILSSRNYSLCQKIPAKNILLSEIKSSQQQLITTNFECLVAKHTHCIMFAPNKNMVFPCMYMLRCNWRYVSLSYKILAFLPHPIILLLVICFKFLITWTVFHFP